MVLLKFIFWVMLFYGIIALVLKHVKPQTVKLPLGLPAIIVSILFIAILSLIVMVGPQEVGVITTPRGVLENPIHTGWHIIAPWNDVHFMDKTVWVYTCANAQGEGEKPNSDAIWAPTKDGIKLGFDVSVSWRIEANQAPWIYQNVTENDGGRSGRYIWLEDNVIRAKLKSALALTVSNYTPIEAYSTKRNDIQSDILKRMKDECKLYRIIIDNVDVREVYYNADYEKAINEKKLAEQEALRLIEVTKQKEEQLKQATIDKNIAIEKAKGESEALKIKGQSISSNPKIIELEWINKWNGQLPTYMMGNGQGIMVNLNNK
ncbi:MAG: prohibitin family protein [Bacteroidales bacterium]|nr:prohibitin family protein [Bacteroidales bacterium]HRX32215.1 prohibitin family protein [Tenuifilaceae bacterium]